MSIPFTYNFPSLAREAGFRLRQYKDGPVDWRLLGSCEIERLLRDQNIEDIDRILELLAEAPLGSVLLDTNILDPAIAKTFLDETVQELRESHAGSQLELAQVKKSLTEANNEILQLNKKLTQIEALHEVIYPCHLCRKNFANNEALNIHIGRKHANHKTSINEKSQMRKVANESPLSAQKDRASDLTLINTIKLELEIKQLKERLNIAEREIKERKDSKVDVTDNHKANVPQYRNIAIQSNLSEEKEKNDSKEEKNYEENEERKSLFDKLQSKIYEIEEWRAVQMANSEDSIAEINRKLSDLAQVLERTKMEDKKTSGPIESESNNDVIDQALERRLSVENLERVLTEKVVEIGRANTEKLEEIVNHLETSYHEKLVELELEVKKVQQESKTSQSVIQVKESKLDNMEKENQNFAIPKNVVQAKVSKISEVVDGAKSDDEGDGTYNIEKEKEARVERLEIQPTISYKFIIEDETDDSLSDDTNVSGSLNAEEKQLPNAKNHKPDKPIQLNRKENTDKPKSKSNEILNAKSPKKYTRRDAKNLANKRLSGFGCDMRIKSLSNGSFKRLKIELNENRAKLKQQYPNYYANRNKIKKFVDKLCSKKSIELSEKFLSTTKTLRPIKVQKRFENENITQQNEDIHISDDNSDNEHDGESLNENFESRVNAAKSEDFKKRLERILASPLHRPVGIEHLNRTSAELTKAPLNTGQPKSIPMPVPRKRVMFSPSISKANNADVN